MTTNLAGNKVLAVAASLGRFTSEDLAVACHQRHPKMHMAGYPEHPNHRHILGFLVGARDASLVHREFIKRTGPNQYQVTQLGKEHAEAFVPKAESEQSRWQVWRTFLARCLDSPAMGDRRTVTVADVRPLWDCWGYGERERIDAFRGQLCDIAEALDDAGELRLDDGRILDAGSVRAMLHQHDWLVERFGRQLGIERERKRA